MKNKPTHRLRKRGSNTVELPYLLSCIVHLLDRRLHILGIRYPVHGTRFDIVARHSTGSESLVLIEAKYRSGDRPIRPSEIQRFADDVEPVRNKEGHVEAWFLTNTRVSPRAQEAALNHNVRTFPYLPLMFRLAKKEEGLTNRNQQRARKRIHDSTSGSA